VQPQAFTRCGSTYAQWAVLTDTPHEEDEKMTKAFFNTTKQGRTPARVARGVRSNRVVRLSGSESGQPVGLDANTAHSASLSVAWCELHHKHCWKCHPEWDICRAKKSAAEAKPNPTHQAGGTL